MSISRAVSGLRPGRVAAALTLLAAAGCGSGREGGRPPSGGGQDGPQAAARGSWLREVTTEIGLDFVHEAGPTGERFLPEIMGGGLGLFDADGDGDLDLYVVNGNDRLPGAGASRPSVNRFFRREADGRFVDATEESGLGDAGYGMGLAVGDVDEDGDPDVYVTNLGWDRLFLNDGAGRFRDATEEAGIDVPGWSTSAGFFDADADGDLDLFVARYVDAKPGKVCYNRHGEVDYCSPRSHPPVPDVLLRNEGGGRFTDVTNEAGIARGRAAGLGVAFADFDADGRMDVYVANDGYANHLWLNQGGWTFSERATSLGVAYNEIGSAEAGMGVLVVDLDEDGHEDIFLTHLMGETNTLYRSRGAGRGFRDASTISGLGAPSTGYTGFGTVALDLELDGDLDLLVANGRVQNESEPWPDSGLAPLWAPFAEPNQVFLNVEGGRFEASAAAAGDFGKPLEISRGLAFGDLDADGDLDIVVGNVAGPARVYLNEAPRTGHWLQVRALEGASDRDALNARVRVDAGGRTWLRPVAAACSYLSSSEPVAAFGLGAHEAVDSIRITWPDGVEESFAGGGADRRLVLRRGTGVQQR